MKSMFRGMIVCAVLVAAGAVAEPFKDLVGQAPVGDVQKAAQVQAPIITWGGDYATIYANGGIQTRPGSIFQKLGLNIKLVKANDLSSKSATTSPASRLF